MRIEFSETFHVPVEEAYSYFTTPRGWVRLFGFSANVSDLGDGWFSVPLKQFPVPLVTRVDDVIEHRHVHWIFKGFWRGEGEVHLEPTERGVTIKGFEEIHIPNLFGLGPWLERRFLQQRFERLWESGWRRLRRGTTAHEARPAAGTPISAGH